MERIFHIRLEVDSFTQVSNRTKVIGQVWRHLVLHRSQTRLQKTTICFRGVDNFYTGLKFSTRWLMIGRCLILHRPQTGGCGTVTYITFQRKVICHRVSNHAAKMHVIRPQTARTAATLPIRVWRHMVSHRSQTRSNSRVSTFVLEVDHFTQVSNNELPPKKSTAVLKVNHFTQVSILDDLKKNLKKSFGGINFTQDSSLELDESGNQVSLEVFDFTQVLNGGTLWICLRFGSILFCIGLKLCTQLHTETRLQR